MYGHNIKKICLDFDSTIVNSIEAICKLYSEDFCYYKDFHLVNWWDINTWEFKELNCASKKHLLSYFNQPRFFRVLEFMPWAERVIEELCNVYQVQIVSCGEYANLKLKEEWIAEKLPQVEFVGVDIHKYKDKSHIDMKDAFFLDDHEKYLKTAKAEEVACFGEIYSWNQNWKGNRLANWMDVRTYLL